MIDVHRLLKSLGIEVVEDAGSEVIARCPSGKHADVNASWTMHVGGEKNAISHCRSCGFDVDAYGLTMHVVGVGFAVAKDWVEEHAVVAEVRAAPSAVIVDPRLRSRAKEFCVPLGVEFGPVTTWPTAAREYLQARNIPAKQVERWQLGYSIAGRLAGRILLPIRNRQGKMRGYTARTFSGQPVRYLNPKKEEGADASAVFGECFWGQDVVCVVEGAINALAVERAYHGFDVAALGGSRVDPAVIAKLSGAFGGFIILMDSDPAGDKAWEGLRAALSRKRVARVRLPEGVDAASAEVAELSDCLHWAMAELW